MMELAWAGATKTRLLSTIISAPPRGAAEGPASGASSDGGKSTPGAATKRT